MFAVLQNKILSNLLLITAHTASVICEKPKSTKHIFCRFTSNTNYKDK